MAWSIVNSPPDKTVQESQVSLTSSSIFNRFKKQNFGSREFKKGSSQISVWGSSGHLADPSSINHIITNPASIHNLFNAANDPVDMSGMSSDAPIGSANGYVFPKPAKTFQGFKSFGIKLGRFGHLYGTGAFHSHREYPHEIQWEIKLIITAFEFCFGVSFLFVINFNLWPKMNLIFYSSLKWLRFMIHTNSPHAHF